MCVPVQETKATSSSTLGLLVLRQGTLCHSFAEVTPLITPNEME